MNIVMYFCSNFACEFGRNFALSPCPSSVAPSSPPRRTGLWSKLREMRAAGEKESVDSGHLDALRKVCFSSHSDSIYGSTIGQGSCLGSLSFEEFVFYSKEGLIEDNEDPIVYWRMKRDAYPILANLARKFLSCPPTSVPSERLFSSAGNIYSDRRSHLDTRRAEKLLFLKYNLSLLERYEKELI